MSLKTRLLSGIAIALGFALFGVAIPRAAAQSFGAGVYMGSVNTFDLREASGLVASRQNPGVLWSHNDTPTPGYLFAISTNGSQLAQWTFPAPFGDEEDISIGPGPRAECQYLYLGNIGDNNALRPSIHVYRLPEPAVYDYQATQTVYAAFPEWQDIELVYPDGPHDAEGMFVDPKTGDLFLFTKFTNSASVYRATRAELDGPQPVLLTYLRTLSFQRISAADISADGSLIAVRRGSNAGLWQRAPGQSVNDAIGFGLLPIPIINEPNGESFAFHPTGLGYYTTSEGWLQPIYFFPRNDPPPQPRVFMPRGAEWRFSDWGDPFSEDWMTLSFDDGGYVPGVAPLGYGGGVATEVSYSDPENKIIATFFRTRFTVTNVAGLTNLALRICFNDGVAVYLNGKEILRRNLATGADYYALASSSTESFRNIWQSFPVQPSLLRLGENVLAVEVHRANVDGPTLFFDAQLAEAAVEVAPRFVGAPRVVNGKLRADLAGPNGRLVKLQRSTDLQEWSTAGSVVLTNGAALFQEPATNARTFYRLAP